MGTQIQYRRGTAAQNNVFTGALGEVTVDTTNGTLRVHDAVTAGGNTLVTLIATQTLTNKTFGGNLTASGNIVLAGNLIATSVRSSTSTTTGALIISGGVGIAGNLNVGTGAGASSTHLILGNLSVNGNIVNGGTSGVGNIGATGATFNTLFAKATSAQYADLAEIYSSDENYSSGTVVVFGGEFEITQSTISHDNKIAGVISTRPAHLMNSAADGLPVALTGRVPCKVLGPVDKGDSLVASQYPGVAQKLNQDLYVPGCVIGKALQAIDIAEISIIEVVVGRL